ncbi:MAG TPA: hypothetical protein VFU49_05230 [Ktedonobacteraceae bacterium]|nr:hypothetical protein [Ktedonobacteraceae bacterium]
MAGSWDGKLKRLVNEAPQDFVSWLLGGALFERELSPHLPHRNVDADLLYQIRLDDEPFLLHLEFQRRSDPLMARRLWEYNVLATCKFDCPVYSFVLYLKKDGKIAESPYRLSLHDGQHVHRFLFGVIKLWELPTDALTRLALPGLLPLLPLTREGKRREVVEDVIRGLCPPGEQPQRELLSLAYGLAALAFEETDDRDWLRRRFRMIEDILEDSWAFQELREKALEQGLEQGIQQGLEQGRLQGMQQGMLQGMQQGIQEATKQEVERLRQILLAFVQARFPALVPLAEQQGKSFNHPEQLQALILNVSVAQSELEAKELLSTIDKSAS